MFSFAFYDDLIGTIQEEINSRSAALGTGAASSFEQYKHSVGFLDGLREAIEIIDSTKLRYLET